MTLETRAAFAARLGVARSTITRAAQAGRLVMQGELVDVEPSLQRWHATTGHRVDVAERMARLRGQNIPAMVGAGHGAQNPASARFTALPGITATTQRHATGLQDLGELDLSDSLHGDPSAADGDPSAADGDPAHASRQHWQAQKLRFENQLIHLENALRQRRRYPRDLVGREARQLGQSLRASVERLVDHSAARIAAEASQPRRAALLQEACQELARQLRTDTARALRRLREQPAAPPASGKP